MTKRAALIVALTALIAVASPSAAVEPLIFAPSDFLAGEVKAFQGETGYTAARIDGRAAVRARCDASASGLVVRRRIDLRETPIVEWSWGVGAALDPAADERAKAGDDYPARLYLISDGGMWPWRTRAINYVWASGEPVGADWPNAYVSQSRMVAVQSGNPSGTWKTQRRDLRADFRRYFDRDVEAIDAVAIMTDCDDRATDAEAWYGEVRFLPSGGNS